MRKNKPLNTRKINEFFSKQIVKIVKTTIIIFMLPVIQLLAIQSFQKQNQIIGTVTEESGLPLVGVSVIITGTAQGTVTDIDGNYSIDIPTGASSLTFSYIGLQTEVITIENSARIDLVMKELDTFLDDVVVVGYGTQRKVNLTGATSVVDQEEIENRSVGKISEVLQGRVAGLETSYSTGGDPDAKLNWQIRGQGSPYILVDGIPMETNELNPNDIESVTVLKDAASAAIYGARAAYGVVLITTKSGKIKMNKTNITYTNNIAFATPTNLPKPMNSLEFANWYNDASLNSGGGLMFSEEVIQRIKEYMQNPETAPSTYPDPNEPNKWGTMMNANANTNWYDVFFNDWKMTHQHNLSIRGGNEKSEYYISGGFFDNSGQMNYTDDKFKRYTLSGNFKYEVTNWLKVNFLPKYSSTISDWPQDGFGGLGYGRAELFYDIPRRWPTDPVKTPDGQWSEWSRIAIYESGARDKYQENSMYLTLGAEINPLKNWDIIGNYTYSNRNREESNQHPLVTLNDINGSPYIVFDHVPPSQIYKKFNIDSYKRLDVYSTYQFETNKHYAKIMLGHNRETERINSINATRQEVITDAVPSLSTAIGRMTNGDDISSWATMGYFARINYNYDEKYLIELNGRYDGSYKYRKEDRWGFFPSFSAAYRISEEKYFEQLLPHIQSLKLRASYGALGDQEGLAYSYLSTLNVSGEIPWVTNSGLLPSVLMPNIQSESLTWETLKTLNFGADVNFFKNRLTANFDRFKRDRIDIITTGELLPSLLGAETPLVNGDAHQTKGWEFGIEWSDKIGSDFQYSLGFNLADNVTKITKTKNPNGILTRDYVGKTLGEIWGFESNGLFQSDEEISSSPSQSEISGSWFPGDVKYSDLDKDGKISYGDNTLENPGDQKIIGNTLPRYRYNLTSKIKWKNFDFSMFWSGVLKKDVWFDYNWEDYLFWGYGGIMWQVSGLKAHLDYWRPDNPDGYYPRQSYDIDKNRLTSTRYLQNGAYLRLKNIVLGYTLPVTINNKVNIENARIYLSGDNLLTFTKLPDTFDPEALTGGYGYGKIYPLSKTISVGVAVTF